MAIKVNGTTVIDDSRNLSNVGGLKTVGGNSILGSGNIEVGGGTPEFNGGKTSGVLASSGTVLPVGAVIIATVNDSYLSSTFGAGYSNIVNNAIYGATYTMNGTLASTTNMLQFRTTNGSNNYQQVTVSSGSWQIIAAAPGSSGEAGMICVRVS